MKRILVLILVQLSFFADAQVKENLISCHLENVPLSVLVEEIEKNTHYKFYYSQSWIDSVFVTINADKQPVETVVTAALQNTSLQFYRYANKIILTRNTPIIEGIDPDFFNTENVSSQNKANYYFEREYISTQQAEGNKTDEVIEVGVRSSSIKENAILVGYVKELKSGEGISGALIYSKKPEKSTTSDLAGFYSISLPSGQHTLYVQYAGMTQEKKNIILHSDGTLNILMQEDVISLKEVIIESERDANIVNLEMGKSKIDLKSMKNVPKILGENDLIRLALTLPGVKSVGEGASGINVRGGNTDQNLMMLNEATIYNTSHFLGFFSVFNADAIKTSELYKSGMPAQYGGRLSSIFDVQLRDGNQNKFSGQGGIGPVTARLTLEAPISKNTSIIAGGRSTYSNWLLKQISEPTLKNSSASFYDLVGRITHKINENNTLYASIYYSNDKFKLGNDSLFSYSNLLGSFQWRHNYSRDLHSILSTTFSEYKYNIDYTEVPENSFNLRFAIKEKNIKWDFNLFKGIHKINFGAQSKFYQVDPGNISPVSSESLIAQDQVQLEKGLENALYIDDGIELSPKISLSLGLRYSLFTALGPRTIYSYNNQGPKDNFTISDTTTYSNNQQINTYHGPELRISTRYSLMRQSSVKISYNRTRQYIHMLSNTVAVSPTSTWKLSDPNVLPQLADQLSAGLYRDLEIRGSRFETSIEAYYKWMQNVIDYKTGSQLTLNKNIEQDILQGKAKAYGAEFLIKKPKGKLNGWISYTYSRTLLQLESDFPSEQINNGQYFPASYDKPHDISVVSNYKFTRRYSLSMNFTYSTGRPVTYPVGQYKFGGGYKINYSDRNQFRIPDYIRLDLGVNIEGNHKIKNIANNFWSISVYNLFGRNNPYSIYFKSENGVVKGYKLSIFGAPIPSITYNFKF
jgi:CarboxypepD_reg-like domain/TonB-dependent Receptor Plug Domain